MSLALIGLCLARTLLRSEMQSLSSFSCKTSPLPSVGPPFRDESEQSTQ